MTQPPAPPPLSDDPQQYSWVLRQGPYPLGNRFWFALIAVLMVVCLSSAIAVSPGVRRALGVYVFLLWLIVCTYLVWLAVRTVHRWRRMRDLGRIVKAAGYRVCFRCCYLLTGSPESGVCPECGLKYDSQELKALWQERLGPHMGYE